jgi:hypothetical protein
MSKMDGYQMNELKNNPTSKYFSSGEGKTDTPIQ